MIMQTEHFNAAQPKILDNNNNSIIYIPCTDKIKLTFAPFPLAYNPSQQPNSPTILGTSILSIPHGSTYSEDGIIIHNNQILKNLIWQNDVSQKDYLDIINPQTIPTPVMIHGKVAVITQNGQFCYYHWMTEVLGRLLLMQQTNITYDYLVVPCKTSYMQESLELLDINMTKILEPYGKLQHIQADELIVPSLINQINPTPTLASYPSPNIIELLRNAFLPKITTIDCQQATRKIFISRKDATVRKLINEDELFEQLQAYGFERYSLNTLSLKEQIALFHHAEIIVGVHGAGLTNILFCKPGTEIIEIFQARADATYWYASQTLGLKHTCIPTCEFDIKQTHIGFFDTTISQKNIDQIIRIVAQKNKESF